MNTELLLPLEKMTIAEKMDVIDQIMADLSRNSGAVPAIEWHGAMLEKRAADIANGTDSFITLDAAEVRIRKNTGRE